MKRAKKSKKLEELLQPHLDDLRTRKVTNKALATQLGYSPEHISRVLKALNLQKDPHPTSIRQSNHQLFAERRAFRVEAAKTLPPKQAARQAKCSLRTIYRYKNA